MSGHLFGVASEDVGRSGECNWHLMGRGQAHG